MKIYNPNLKKDIVNELYYLDSEYFQFDLPIPFKEGLVIQPVNIKNYNKFMICSECLTLDRTQDPDGILLSSNLEFLLLKMTSKEEGAKYSQYFLNICEMCFGIPYGVRCIKCGKIYSITEFVKKANEEKDDLHCECGEKDCFKETFSYSTNPETKKPELNIAGIKVDAKEFDRLRQIIMYQNLPDYKDDSWVDPDVKADQEEKHRLLAKKNKSKDPGIEKKIVCVSSQTCYKIEELYKMSIRKFLMLLTAVDDAMTYQSTKIGLMTGMVSLKEPLEHWIYKNEQDDLYGSAVDAGEFKNKIASVN